MHRSQDQRINLGEVKGHIVKKIGVERSKRYFYYLSRFLSQKLTKSEFDKTCFRLLGRENLSLHNQLIGSILRNATVSKPVANSPEGSNGKVVHMVQQPPSREDNNRGSSVVLENGYLIRYDHKRPGSEFLCPAAKPRIPCKEEVETAAVRDDNQEEQASGNVSASPLVAPLGIQFCSASVGGGSRRRVPVSTSGDVMSCYGSGGLPDTEMLRRKMENIAVAHGLEGVSTECANTLNTLLDVYLKKLIKSCIDLVGARSRNGGDKQQSQNKVVNGVWSSNSLQMQTPDRRKDHYSVSLLDFRTAMELNPHHLGVYWPTLLERISIRSFEEQDSEV